MQKGFVTTEKKEKNADFNTLYIYIYMIQNSAKSLWLVALLFFGTRLCNSPYPSDWRALKKKRPFKTRIRKFLLTVVRVEDAYVDCYSLITNLNNHYCHGTLQLCSLPLFIYLFQWYCNNYVTFLHSVYCVILMYIVSLNDVSGKFIAMYAITLHASISIVTHMQCWLKNLTVFFENKCSARSA